MITTFSLLHHQVIQGSVVDFSWVIVHKYCIFLLQVLVYQFLPSRQVRLYHKLFFVW